MRIASLTLTNFKRFTELTIKDLPATTKLVLLIGSNGSGKSSVFDGLNLFARRPWRYDEKYYAKTLGGPPQVSLTLHDGRTLTDDNISKVREAQSRFFGRPSVRVIPQMQPVSDAEQRVSQDTDNPVVFTAFDQRFLADVAQFTGQIDRALREPTFEGRSADTVAIFRQFIDPLNDSLRRVFGESSATTIQIKSYENADPQKPIQLFFSKGQSVVPFDLLSHGEKQIVILLMNFAVRREHYQDAVYFIDEMDLHLNTALQKTVLHEIVEHWIPGDSQLWTASHALGFIEFADESANAVIIDFNDLDFDQPQVLTPRPKQGLSIFEIAVPRDSLARLFAGRKVIACEGKDDALYNAACDDDSRIFVPAGNAAGVFAMVVNNPAFLGVRDRDFLLRDEVARLRELYPNLRILPFYSIENLLYHPDNVASLHPAGYDIAAWREAISEAKTARPLREVRYARGRIPELRNVPAFQGQRPPAWEADPTEIYAAYDSTDFDTFYPVVPMKNLPKTYLEPFQLTLPALARAPWFMSTLKRLTD